ncbi:MAG TPA: hypothetical protein H9814_08080, partial [Candidatus Bacteroides merdigallinarum]|nr:hypothetical protein [Candidatus Bacteroides merdigallinarum]
PKNKVTIQRNFRKRLILLLILYEKPLFLPFRGKFSAKILHISKYTTTFAPHLRKNNTLR